MGQDAYSDNGGQTLLAGRYQILHGKPLPELDSPHAQAFEARDQRASTRSLFALLCQTNLLPRLEIIPPLSRILRQPLVVPVEAGPLAWPQGGRRFVIVFEYDIAGRVMAGEDAQIAPMREDEVVRKIVKPLIPALKTLAGRHIPHRAIRADNIFYKDSSKESVVLGECVSAPPALGQPSIYEPIESAMCSVSGRGQGHVADDMYAFGVLLMVLLNGGNPCAGRSDEQVIRSKIGRGSYATLIGEARVTISLMEPLRGLLCDDPKERWTVADLEQWAAGRQLSPKQPMLPTRAARNIAFAGKDFINLPSLAHAMGVHWRDAPALITGGELESWIRRSLSQDDLADGLQQVMSNTPNRADGEAHLVCRALMVLAPRFPLQFKEFVARIDALPQAFAIEFHNQPKMQALLELIGAKLPQTYLQLPHVPRSEQATLMKIFDMFNFFLENNQLGGGIERALYESNKAWPCQSPLLRGDFVSTPTDLLDALEALAREGRTDREPVDRHIAAFCCARIKGLPDRIMKNLNARDDVASFRLGVLHLLAEVQRGDSSRRYPALSRWLAQLLQPVVQSYHNRQYRERLAQELEGIGDKGDLLELLFLVDSMEARSQDNEGFAQAQKEYAGLARATTWLKNGGLTSEAHVRAIAQQGATVISAVLSGAAVVFMTVLYAL